MYHMIQFYDLYDTNHCFIKFISTYDTKLFINNTIRITYHTILTIMIKVCTITTKNLQLLEVMHILD